MELTHRHRRIIEVAYAVAIAGTGVRRNCIRHGAVLTDGNRIISAKHNSYKTHPKAKFYHFAPALHAEQAVLFHHGLDNCDGMTLYVVRVMGNGEFGYSNPCKVCRSIICMTGLKRVIYTVDKDNIEQWRL